MSQKIRRYSVPTLFSICVVLLLALPVFHAADIAFALPFSSTVTTASGTGEEPHAAIDGYGFIYLTYEEGTTSVDFRKSTDSGANFSGAVKVAEGVGYFPRIAINNAEEAYVVYTSYEDLASGNYWPRGFRSTNGAFSEILNQSDLPGTHEGADEKIWCDIAVENIGGNDNVYVVWPDAYNAPGDFTIDFISSPDGGANWGAANGGTQAKISTTPDARYPALAVKGDGSSDVYAAWVRLGSNIMFRSSPSKGEAASWGAEIPISDAGPSVQNQRPGLAASDIGGIGWVFANWCANSSGNQIYFDYSSDGGANWNTDKHLGNSGYWGFSQDQPSIAVRPGSNHVYAAWRDMRDGTPHIYFQEATYVDAATGFRWGIDLDGDGTVETGSEEGADLRVNENSSGDEGTPTVIAGLDGKVYVTWHDAGASIKCAGYNMGSEAGPSAPTNLTAVGGNELVTLEWDDNTEADFSSYNIYRSTTRGSWPSTATYTSAISQYTDAGVTNGTIYWYVVTAVDTEGWESNYSNDAHATPNVGDVTAPDEPTSLTATAGNLKVDLSWTASASADISSYHVYRSLTSGSSYSYVGSVDAPTVSYPDTGLITAGVKYYYVVTAIDTNNNESSDSNEASATPLNEYGQAVLPPAEFPAGPGLLRTSDSDCFIATAAYGTPLAIEVRTLSLFRDNVLLSSGMGRQFVKAYQKLSPPLAGFIARRPWLKTIVRAWLKPIVKVSRMLVEE